MKEYPLITSSLLIFLAMVQRMVIECWIITFRSFAAEVLTIQTSQRKLLVQFRAWDNPFWFED